MLFVHFLFFKHALESWIAFHDKILHFATLRLHV